MSLWEKIFGKKDVGSETNTLKCGRCGKRDKTRDDSGKIVVGATSSFNDMVGKCQSCGFFVCGGCAVKEAPSPGITCFKCPQCAGTVGPA